jgi:hypothetical protein
MPSHPRDAVPRALLSSDRHGEFVTEPVGVRLTVQQLGPPTTRWRWSNKRASRWPGSRASRNVLHPDAPRDGLASAWTHEGLALEALVVAR